MVLPPEQIGVAKLASCSAKEFGRQKATVVGSSGAVSVNQRQNRAP
jgi:hypothetical protein